MTEDAAAKYLEADIPDPTDFTQDELGLRELDEALRCTMCRELFEAPVTVNCPQGHCFCSLVRPETVCGGRVLSTEGVLEVHTRRNGQQRRMPIVSTSD
jgi:E3 ubiquitin-protein ligase RAD18